MRKLQRRQRNDLSRSVTALDMDTTLIAVVERSLSSGLVAGIVPGREQMTLIRIFRGAARTGLLAATAHPTAEWIAQQLTEACGWHYHRRAARR